MALSPEGRIAAFGAIALVISGFFQIFIADDISEITTENNITSDSEMDAYLKEHPRAAEDIRAMRLMSGFTAILGVIALGGAGVARGVKIWRGRGG